MEFFLGKLSIQVDELVKYTEYSKVSNAMYTSCMVLHCKFCCTNSDMKSVSDVGYNGLIMIFTN